VRTLLERAEPGRRDVMVHSHGGYTTNVPLDALLGDDVLVAHSFGGAPLGDHGGPARCSC
jgi:DMSO/TMAO reductase YedYZ molybdopterin-dependent catalytic subunit